MSKIYAQALCTGQQNYQEKFTAEGWKEWKFAYLPPSAITRSLRFAYSQVKNEMSVFLLISAPLLTQKIK